MPHNEKRRLHYHAYRAQQKNQSEVCDMISINRNSRINLHFLKNNTYKAGSFRIFAADVVALRQTLGKSKRFIGLFHSHVVSEAIPGARDLKEAYTSHLQLIYDVCGRVVRLWRIKNVKGRKIAVEVPLILAPRKK